MAINTSKFSMQYIYSQVAFYFGKVIADGVEVPPFERVSFIRMVNAMLDDITLATDCVERLAILTPDRRWLRYIKVSEEEASNGIVRIDLEGQTPTLLSSDDPDNLDWQYESPCTGEGTDPDYVGSLANNTAQDSFPKIYLSAESNIPEGVWTANDGIPNATGNQDRIGGTNEPLTPFVVDMRKGGYGSNDPTSDNYPTAGQTDLYFIDTRMIYAMRKISYTTGNDGSVPLSADAYLNTNWETILGMAAGAGVAAACVVPTFVLDGTTYTVAVTVAGYNSTTDAGYTFTITGAGQTFTYIIRPSYTPWQTVATQLTATEGTNAWGDLFSGQALYSNRAWYIKLNDFVLRMPDDLHKIKWLWKIPVNTIFNNIPEPIIRITFTGLTTIPNVGETLTQLTSGATLIVTGTEIGAFQVWGTSGGTGTWTNTAADTVTGGAMIPAVNVVTTVESIPDDFVETSLADVESYQYSRLDDAYHYFPITESRFTQLKYLETQGYNFNGAGFYIQSGQQLRLVPRPVDMKSAVIALMYDAKADSIDESTPMSAFPTTYVELPSPAVKAIIYAILSDVLASPRGGGNMDQAMYFTSKYERELRKLDNLYSGRGKQSHDAPALKNILDPGRNTRHMGIGYLTGRGK